jgi:tRNA threonylcarbamoyladenosine biosynthesis protein TsaB
LKLNQLDAIAISAGPGSYTGLRVGMATAKGLCYALKKPLIAINTLKMMANAALPASTNLLCPMIDARRMEVFTAVYDGELREVRPYSNLILQPESFSDLLENQTISFFGNGSAKFQAILRHSNAVFVKIEASALNMAGLSHSSFVRGNFTELAYSQPFYGKDFHSPVKQSL